jgi:hypothetical protein
MLTIQRPRFFCLGSASVLLMLALSTAHAAEPDTFQITPFGGYRFGGEFDLVTDDNDPLTPAAASDLELGSAPSYGLVLNLEQNAGAYYELFYSRQGAKVKGSSGFDMTVEYLHIGGNVDFARPEDRVIPYFVLTIGGTRFVPDVVDAKEVVEPSLSLGGGVRIPLAPHIGLRLEARGFLTLLDSDSRIFCEADPPNAICDVRVKGDMFVQAQGLFGVTIGF